MRTSRAKRYGSDVLAARARAGAGWHDARARPGSPAQARQLLAQRGHAWLLQGPSGLGQYSLALELARAWLCEQPAAGRRLRPVRQLPRDRRAHPCGPVRADARDRHAGAGLAAGAKRRRQDIDDKKRKPSKEIRVEAMRDAVEFAQRTSGRGRGKVVLVYPAERMNHVTANALLKTLEEPAGDLRFVLASEAAHQLLPTIRSRCLGHTMAWPDADEAMAWLAGAGRQGRRRRRALLRAAGGRPGGCAGACAGRPRRPRPGRCCPRRWRGATARALADWTPAQAVDALQKLCHDLLAVKAGAAPRFFEPADLPAAGLVRGA